MKFLQVSIEQFKVCLENLIIEKGNLLDPEVIKVSQKLDRLITAYQELCVK